jgi:hypothetical protein
MPAVSVLPMNALHASCRIGSAAAAGRRAATRINAAGAAATLSIPADDKTQLAK